MVSAKKKRREGRGRKGKKIGLLGSNRGRCGVARGREAGERGDALKPARILKIQIVGWR
jgi:hypothetical protein